MPILYAKSIHVKTKKREREREFGKIQQKNVNILIRSIIPFQIVHTSRLPG